MNRRSFLFTSTAAVAATALARTHAQDAPKKTRKIRKALNLNMIQGQPTLRQFEMAKEAGFEGLEINRPDALPLDELLKARDATGLEFAGVICSTHWGKPLTHNDPVIREQGLRGLKLALQEAGELGCSRLLLVPGVVNQDVSYADAWTRSIAAIKEVIPLAEKARCKIGVENVWNHFLLSPLEAARFVDEISSPWVGWHFDIGNVVTFGWPEQWVRILGERIINLHIKDFSRKKRDAEGFSKGFNVELGEGDAGWPAVMKALDEIRYEGWGIAEVKGGDAARIKFLADRMDQLFAS